jgi:hypothetical protein
MRTKLYGFVRPTILSGCRRCRRDAILLIASKVQRAHGVLEDDVVGADRGQTANLSAELAEDDASGPDDVEGANKDSVELRQNGEDGGKEVGTAVEIRPESGVGSGCRIP